MIYTASYFHPEHHHGRLISISRSNPKKFARIPKIDFFTPSKGLSSWWKKSEKTDRDWENYQDRFFEETIDTNYQAINTWVNGNSHRHDITLLCWESPGEYCHRNDVGEILANRIPWAWGGFDVPQTRIEKMVVECQTMGIAVRCDRLTFDNDFVLYQLNLNKKSIGVWSDHETEHILGQLLYPTNPSKWFGDRGIDLDKLQRTATTR